MRPARLQYGQVSRPSQVVGAAARQILINRRVGAMVCGTPRPQIPSANIPGDPIAVVNQVLGISATSVQVTAMASEQLASQPNTPGGNNWRVAT